VVVMAIVMVVMLIVIDLVAVTVLFAQPIYLSSEHCDGSDGSLHPREILHLSVWYGGDSSSKSGG
jgi:hypothetical protein